MDLQETLVEDWRLQWPFRLLVAGSSGCGKTTLLVRLVSKSAEVMSRTPTSILLFYAHMQDAYQELKSGAPCPVVMFPGGPSETLKTKPGTLVIVDDMQSSHSEEMAAWFTRKSHHFDSSVVYLVQNIFDKTPHHRTVSLNSSHIVLFRNPRDSSQVHHLDKQVFPGSNGLLSTAYDMATRDAAHSYIVVDFNQSTPRHFRLRNTLFPLDDFPNAYAYVLEGDLPVQEDIST